MRTQKGARFWLALVIFSLTGQVAWVVENMYLNVFIYKMFGASAGDISLMVGASAVAATVTTLVIGALSDKVGRRKVFICGGYLLWGVSIVSFAFIRTDTVGALFPMAASASAVCVTLVILLDCAMTFFGSAANDACFNAWLTDATDHTNRGAAEGINAMMPLVAILAVFGGFMAFDLDQQASWTAIFLIIGGAVCLIGLAGLFLIRETTQKTPENTRFFRNIFYGFTPSVIRQNGLLYLYLLAFAVFGIAIQIFMPYLILYYEVSLGLSNYVLIMAPAVIVASVFTAFFGRWYDRIGFKRAVTVAVLLLMTGFALLSLFRQVALVFAGSLLMMSGYLSGMAAFGAVIREKTPPTKAGMFQGLRIVGQVLIPGMIGPAIGAAVLANAATVVGNDGTASFIPHRGIFVAALAVCVVLWGVLAVIFRRTGKEASHA
ncbi:MAG: MFS transporter [Ruminococcaceae bacterium]|nr:MFS transporter [Oscillospiraceae bacterium]